MAKSLFTRRTRANVIIGDEPGYMYKKHKLKHTPGPWVADGFAEEYQQETRVGTAHPVPQSATIALCQTNHEDPPDLGGRAVVIGPVAAEANAKLISAAPELLEAAIETLYFLNSAPDSPRQWPLARANLHAMLSKAVSKAGAKP